MPIAVVGTGAWGTTLAIMLARAGHEVVLLARDEAEAERLAGGRQNQRFLPSVDFPPGLAVAAVGPRLGDCDTVFLVVPSRSMRANVRALRAFLQPSATLVSATKGLEMPAGLRMSEVLSEELRAFPSEQICVLSGPNLAAEVALGQPTSTVIASTSPDRAAQIQQLLMSRSLRAYTSEDVVGVELAGALKNIIAIAAGVSDGLECGDNARAALITRGLAEMRRLGTVLGANPETFAGMAGIGDLVATCASQHSRNHAVGVELAKGRSWPEIEASMVQVAEGVPTTRAALTLGRKHGVELPIAEQVAQVLFEGKSVRQAYADLMGREPKPERE